MVIIHIKVEMWVMTRLIDATGKGESIWDRTVHRYPEKVTGRANGDVATDSYHKYKEDVQLLRNAGVRLQMISCFFIICLLF